MRNCQNYIILKYFCSPDLILCFIHQQFGLICMYSWVIQQTLKIVKTLGQLFESLYTGFPWVKKFHTDPTCQNLYSFQGWWKPTTKSMGSSRFRRWSNTLGMAQGWLPVHKLFVLPLHSKHAQTPPDSLIWTTATAFEPHADWQIGGQQQWVGRWDELGWVWLGLGGVKGQDVGWDCLNHIWRMLLADAGDEACPGVSACH